ncbi:putative glycolipid-binding domain-containing protein [Streptomyces sp. NBC_01198]|uniref:putative glycolipid-binding domain-containing protein n=1 Tax=Streptomyces sp. NBC_01198 TaxID=2903769 RepID=UPI002E12FD55|nr:putative glycolipid-binding domain-containing protein [Streptomyces sp. NBC_01198]
MTATTTRTWDVIESQGYETAWITVGTDTLHARGRAVGTVPEPYWISYELETGEDFVTRSLRVTAETATATRELDLRRRDDGRWSADGVVLPEVDGALDCDLGLCPVTNAMPVLRHGLHLRPGRRRFLMAWVSVPDLTVRLSRQTYTHLSRTDTTAVIRYESGDYRSDVTFDEAGLVLTYPGMARPLGAAD